MSGGVAPLRIDPLPVPGGATLGLMALPGRPPRDLAADLAVIRAWGATMLVTLVESEEVERYGVSGFAAQVARSGIVWRRFPIPDMAPPGDAFAAAWRAQGEEVITALRSGARVAMHCVGGLGRTGTVAARLLVAFGADPEAAIARVRVARPGAIETEAQAAFVRAAAPLG